jgi:hypothetical protein
MAAPTFSHLDESLATTSQSVGNSVSSEYCYASSVHQMLAWPAFQACLPELPFIDATTIERDGPSLVLGLGHGMYRASKTLSTDTMDPGPFEMASGLEDNGGHGHKNTPIPAGLDWATMQRLCKAYFESFNFVHPILDRQTFINETLPVVFNSGFDNGILSTLAFLTFALGEVAIAGTQGAPVRVFNGRPSGVRGGSEKQPPGLALFNEARRRMGFSLTDCSLENVQVFALAR